MSPLTPEETRVIRRRVLLRFCLGALLLWLMFFLPAGTLSYWQAWTYLAVLLGAIGTVLVVFLHRDPELLERRIRTREPKKVQRRIVSLSTPLVLLAFLVPGFDRRFGWSDVPGGLAIAADVVVLLGYILFVLVLKENSYASRVVDVEPGQRLIRTGPYAVIRHPMYVSAIIIMLASPLALGSYWGILAMVLYPLVLILRIRSEEAILAEELNGYREYMTSVRYRLLPRIW